MGGLVGALKGSSGGSNPSGSDNPDLTLKKPSLSQTLQSLIPIAGRFLHERNMLGLQIQHEQQQQLVTQKDTMRNEIKTIRDDPNNPPELRDKADGWISQTDIHNMKGMGKAYPSDLQNLYNEIHLANSRNQFQQQQGQGTLKPPPAQAPIPAAPPQLPGVPASPANFTPAKPAPGPQVGAMAGMLPQGAQQQTAAAQAAPSAPAATIPPPPDFSLEGQVSDPSRFISGPAQAAARAGGVATAQADVQRKIADQKVADIKQSANWDKLTPRQQFSLEASMRLGKDVNISPEMRPQFLSRGTSGMQILAAEPGATDVMGAPVGPGQYAIRALGDGTREYVPIQAQTRAVLIPDPDSPSKFSRILLDAHTNQQVGEKQMNALPPAGYVPTVVESQGVRFVQQPDNTWAEVPVTTVSKRSKDIPGIPPPPGGSPAPSAGGSPALNPPPAARPSAPVAGAGAPGRTVGGKGLTPNERVTWTGRLGAFDNTLELAKKVQSRIPLLNSLLTAGKITLQTDPKQGVVHGLLNRAMSMSDDEKQLAADVTSLIEHINTIRGPLGATGFRGPEAWGGLQAQRGNLMANPDITKGVLANTIKALQTQRQAIARGLAGKGPLPQGDNEQPAESGARIINWTRDASGKPVPVTQ